MWWAWPSLAFLPCNITTPRVEGDMGKLFYISFNACPPACVLLETCPEAPLGRGNAVNPALGARRAGVGNLIRRQCVQVAGEKAAGQR